MIKDLREKWKGVRTPEASMAARPYALLECSIAGDSAESWLEGKDERERV